MRSRRDRPRAREELIEQGTNQFRAEQGAGRVAADATLERAARGLADFMARTDKYGHDADGSSVSQRVRRAGYDSCMVSENIALHYNSEGVATANLARIYVQGWKDSPGHRRNMLDPGATDLGVAVARSPTSGRYYAVQVFARPRARAVEFRVTNASKAAAEYSVDGRGYTVRPGEARIHTVCSSEDVSFPAAENGKGRSIRPSGGENIVVRGGSRPTIGVE